MSIKSAKAFYDRLTTDKTLQRELRNAARDEQRLEIIQAAGYRFTRSEWQAVLAELDENQLSDAELEAIAGGISVAVQGAVNPPLRVTWSRPKVSGAITSLRRWLAPPAWSLGTKLAVALLSVALIPMGFAAYYNLQESLEQAEDSEYRNLELLAISNAGRLDQLIVDIQRVVVQVSTESSAIDFLAATSSNKQAVLLPELQQTLDNVFRSNPDYDAVYVMDKKGRCLAATDPTFVGQNYAFREYFQAAIAGKPYVSSASVGATSEQPGIYFSHPVRFQSAIVGVAVLKIKGEDIWSIVNSLQAGTQSYAFLVDQQGIIISHPDRALLYQSLAPLPPEQFERVVKEREGEEKIESLNLPKLAAAMVEAQEPGHLSYYSPQEEMHLMVGFAPLEQEPWVLGVNQPRTQFAAPLYRLIWEHSRSLLVVGAIAAILSLLLARSIARPIRDLTEAAQALEQDTFEPRLLKQSSRSQDDIGQLVRVFLQMAEQIKAREHRLKQQVSELHIEIDEVKKVDQVAEITETDYFQQLQQKAQALKRRGSTNE